MTKQRVFAVIAAAFAFGTFGVGCSSNDNAAASKPPAQIQADAQKSAAAQGEMYKQKMGQK